MSTAPSRGSPDPEPESWLRDWFAERGADEPLNPNDNYFENGLIDSFGAIELIEEVETHFSIRFTERDFQDRRFASLAGLAELINKKRRG